MKKLLTVLLTLLMVFTLVGCNSKQDTPVVEEPQQQEEVVEPVQEEVVGGFVEVEDKTLTDELKDIFTKALYGLTGASYEPQELVATQVVAGTNYKFLANGTKTTNPITKGTYYITIYKDLQGNVELLDIETIEEKQEEKKKVDPTIYDYWVVVYDQFGNEISRTTAKYGTTVKDPDGKDVVVKGNTYFHTIVDYPSSKEDDGQTPTPTVTKYTVTFDMQGYGTQIADISNITSGTKITKPANPTATDLIFKGWYKEPTFENEWDFNVDTVISNTTLYAKWAMRISYFIGDDFPVEANAWTNGQNGICYYKIEGIKFLCFKNGLNSVEIQLSDELSKLSNNCYTYRRNSDGYTVTFNMNAGELNNIKFVADDTADSYIQALEGTYTAPTGNICTITLNPNGGTGGSDSTTVTVGASSVTAFTMPTKEGYQLDGWYNSNPGGSKVLSPDGQTMYGAESITAPTDPITWDRTDPITLHAHWTANNYTVKFDANGGEGAMADQSFVYDAPDTLAYNSFTAPGGMTFFHWNTSPDNTGESYDGGMLAWNLTNVPDGEVTLYAIWQ